MKSDERIYETFNTYQCPKCGWNNKCITDDRRWLKTYNGLEDKVMWRCPDCGYQSWKDAFKLEDKIDVTEEVQMREQYKALLDRLTKEAEKKPHFLFVNLQEWEILKYSLSSMADHCTQNELSVRGIRVDIKEENDEP